jgi:hypothetical protein
MRVVVTGFALLALLSAHRSALASATFPKEVDTNLMLKVPVEAFVPPQGQGCRLCHQSDSGGNGTNNAFGTMMKRAGCMGTITGSVDVALNQLKASAPRAIMDIEMSVDPNGDPLALNNDPLPQYGCGSVAGRAAHGGPWMLPAFAAAALGLGLLRRHARPRHAGERAVKHAPARRVRSRII